MSVNEEGRVDFHDIQYQVSNRVATITIDREHRLNGITVATYKELVSAFDRTDDDDEVRAVVVTGAGRAFSSGADLQGGGKTFESKARTGVHRDKGGLLALRIFESRKPVIAAVNGAAVGLGATLTLPMDVRLASTTARFGFGFANRGISPDGCSSWFLPRLVGMGTAAEWMLTGRLFGADEALASGLVHAAHPPKELLPAALELAWSIATRSAPVSAAVTRQLLWRMQGAAHPVIANYAESVGLTDLGRSPDAREGITAFFEKRTPDFRGSVSAGMP